MSDREERALERRAACGDEDAKAALVRARARALPAPEERYWLHAQIRLAKRRLGGKRGVVHLAVLDRSPIYSAGPPRHGPGFLPPTAAGAAHDVVRARSRCGAVRQKVPRRGVVTWGAILHDGWGLCARCYASWAKEHRGRWPGITGELAAAWQRQVDLAEAIGLAYPAQGD